MSSRLQFLAAVASLALAVHISPSVVYVPVGTVSEVAQYAVSGLSPFIGLIATLTLNHHCGSACTTFKAALISTTVVPCAALVSQCSSFQYPGHYVELDTYLEHQSKYDKYPQKCDDGTRACYQALVHGSGKAYLFRTKMHKKNFTFVLLDNDFQCCSVDLCNKPLEFNEWKAPWKPSTTTTSTDHYYGTKSKPSGQTMGNANHTSQQPSTTGTSTNQAISGPSARTGSATKSGPFGPVQYALSGVLGVSIIGMLITGILFCVAMSGKICATVEAPSADVPNKELDPSML
ncbi:hypothetical protein AAVH_01398 [Aphelenchoides avenae]|nr:hypothetical protein AAVH_01398 [Aphelenchus avenae]